MYSSETFYKSEDVFKYLGKLESENKNMKYGNWFNYRIKKPTMKGVNGFLEARVFEKDYTSWFQEIGCPVFRFIDNPNIDNSYIHRKNVDSNRKMYVEKNPILKNLNFFRTKDSFSAFQEIGQFIGGVLTSTEVVPDILNDNEKVKQHGFDEKYGFRKRPRKK